MPKRVQHKREKRMNWKPGQPCDHPGCLSHVTHPCEGCGRIAGGMIPFILDENDPEFSTDDVYRCPYCWMPDNLCGCIRDFHDLDHDDVGGEDWMTWAESSGVCPCCGGVMLDDMEIGQGYHVTCWMWATGQN